jgi:hypothetical protein
MSHRRLALFCFFLMEVQTQEQIFIFSSSGQHPLTNVSGIIGCAIRCLSLTKCFFQVFQYGTPMVFPDSNPSAIFLHGSLYHYVVHTSLPPFSLGY